MNSKSVWFDFWVLVVSLTIARAPMLFGDNSWKIAFSVISIIPLWIVIIKNLFIPIGAGGRLLKPLKNGIFWPYVLVLVLVLFAFIRGQIYGALPDGFMLRHLVWWVTIVLFGIAVFLVPRNKWDLISLRRAIYYCLGLYVVFNVILQLVGIESELEVLIWESFGKATVLSYVGIDATRVAFATASGPGPFGVVAGLVALIGGAIFIDRKKSINIRTFGILMLVSGIYSLLLSDTRSAILWVMVSPIVVFVCRRRLKPLLTYMPIGYLVFPGLLMIVAIFLSSTSIGENVGRSEGSYNIATLSNRAQIWGIVLDEIKEFKPIHLVGYGIYGQVTSGAGSKIAVIAEKNFTTGLEHKTAHSFVLQSFLDVGYLGLLVIIIFMMRLFKVVSEMGIDEDRKLHEIFLVFVVLAGTTEVVPAIYTLEIATAMALLAISLLRQYNKQGVIQFVSAILRIGKGAKSQ